MRFMSDGYSLTILGCGTSTGVPVPSCLCPVCSSSSSKNRRLRCSALIKTPDNKNILIDAGPDFRQQALQNGIERIDLVLFTHAHADHILGIDDLRAYNFTMGRPIDCYGTTETLDAIKKVFHYIFDPDPDYQGGMLASLNMHPITHGEPLFVGNTQILPFLLFHGRTAVTGFKIGSIAYATDCNYIPEETEEQLRGVKHLVLDGLRYRKHATHFTITEAVKISQSLNISNTYLTHMSHDIDYHETVSSLPENVTLCYDGLIIKDTVDGHV